MLFVDHTTAWSNASVQGDIFTSHNGEACIVFYLVCVCVCVIVAKYPVHVSRFYESNCVAVMQD